jgi:beta-aspartyl-peptidase (threonine type)
MKAHAASGTAAKASEAEKHGTVGAVALDSAGHLAAATSTGGYNNKPAGRIGDTPIIGAGTYARDGVCAVSGTGKGEYFMRYAVGHEVASRIAYLGESLEKAASKVIQEDLKPHNIGAGLIAVDADGSITAPYNTDGMFRGWVTPSGEFFVATHGEVFALPQ